MFLDDRTPKELESIKYSIIIAIIANIFGIWWYLGLKKLGMALLLVGFGFLAYVMFIERRKTDKMDEFETEIEEVKEEIGKNKKEETKKQEKPLITKKSDFPGFDLGIPSADEWEKRSEEAIGKLDLCIF